MKTGIIGLPQVGKTSLFKILTKADISNRTYANPREAHIGFATDPDDRLDRLAKLFNPKKLVHARVEYADVAAVGAEALKETAFLTALREIDALILVLRAFENESVPHEGDIDPLADIKKVEFDLIISDLSQVESRLERMKKDLQKKKTDELVKEHELLLRAKDHLESERPLREMEMSKDEKKLVRGFMFLSEKPILYVLNISESMQLVTDLEAAGVKLNLSAISSRPNTGATAICG